MATLILIAQDIACRKNTDIGDLGIDGSWLLISIKNDGFSATDSLRTQDICYL